MPEVVGLCRTSSECRKQVFSRRNLYGLNSGIERNYKIAHKVVDKPINHVNNTKVGQSFRKNRFYVRTSYDNQRHNNNNNKNDYK